MGSITTSTISSIRKDLDINVSLKGLYEIGMHTLAQGQGRGPYSTGNQFELEDEEDEHDDNCLAEHVLRMLDRVKLIKVDNKGIKKPLIACDTSVVKVAEVAGRKVLALRGALAYRNDGKVGVTVIGPYLLQVAEDSKELVYDYLMSLIPDLEPQDVIHSLDYLVSNVGNIFERWLQLNLVRSVRSSIILIDGSLSLGSPQSSERLMDMIVDDADSNKNYIVALSKSTKLRLIDRKITCIDASTDPPYLIDVNDAVKEHKKLRCAGKIYVAKLSKVSFPFRVDLSPSADPVSTLSSLLVSDFLIYGYPETLLLAHAYCTFTKADVIGIQSMLSSRFNLKVFDDLEVRQTIFYPFDGG